MNAHAFIYQPRHTRPSHKDADALATSPRGPALASPSRARANLRHPSPLPPVPAAPQAPVGGIVLPLQHSPRQASPSPRTLATASPAREQK